TALAEAEIEYADHKSPSIFVLYPLENEKDAYAMIWTTTPWTLPASMAISYNEKEEYVFVTCKGSKDRYLMAKALVPKECHLESSVQGTKLKNFKARHPWLDREIPFFPGDHVTMDAGTGLVHTAPGH